MATRVTTHSRMSLEAVLQPTAPHEGGVTHTISSERQLGHGTGSYQADKVYRASMSVGTSGTEIDLQTATDAYGVALGLDEVVAFSLAAAEANTGNILIAGGAANPWEAILLATGDGIKILPGARMQYEAPVDGSLPVTSSAKTVKVYSSTGTQAVEVMFVGRSQ